MGSGEFPTKRAILIAGPTASGKSMLATTLAEQHDGVVINADSMQVYSDLHILTARPSAADTARVPHRLFGHVDAGEAYSVGRWLEEVRVALAETWTANQMPILVGGTGLYFKALTQGLSAMPRVPDAVRLRWRTEAATSSASDLHRRLAALDPLMADRLKPSDPQRILRALEIFDATGQSLHVFQSVREAPLLPSDRFFGIFLAPPRETLTERIDQRFDAMMANGAMKEAATLAARKLDPTLPSMRAVGVPHLLATLGGAMPLHVAVAQAKIASRQYAKRQLTFARHQLQGLSWVEPSEAQAAVRENWR